MKYIQQLFLGVQLTMVAGSCAAYESWTGPYQPYLGPGQPTYSIAYDYTITGERDPGVGNAIACNSRSCFFAPIVRTGLGPGPAGLCDSGGICNPDGLRGQGTYVNNGTTWNEAYDQFIAEYGKSGRFVMDNWIYPSSFPYVRWDALCVGFAILPLSGVSISTLAPGSTCASVPKPNLQCSINFPNLIDFGTVNVGETDLTTSSSGSITCGDTATVSAALMNVPKLDGQTVSFRINGTLLSTNNATVGQGQNVPLLISATINGTLRNAGSYTDSAVIQISYR